MYIKSYKIYNLKANHLSRNGTKCKNNAIWCFCGMGNEEVVPSGGEAAGRRLTRPLRRPSWSVKKSAIISDNVSLMMSNFSSSVDH